MKIERAGTYEIRMSVRIVCRKPLRGGGTCALDAGHRGRHTSVAFDCDGCSKMRPGRPYAVGDPDTGAEGMQFCFLCASPVVLRRLVGEQRMQEAEAEWERRTERRP